MRSGPNFFSQNSKNEGNFPKIFIFFKKNDNNGKSAAVKKTSLNGLFLKEIGIAALVKFYIESVKYVTAFAFLDRKIYKKKR